MDDDLAALVEYIARQLVEEPDLVEVDVIGHHSNVTIELRVSPVDMGRVIGRGGRVANAIRSLLRVMTVDDRRRVKLEIM